MSATNRGGERQPEDYYSTPAWCVDQLLDRLTLDDSDRWFIDPGCGDGAIIERAIASGILPGFVVGVENDKGRAAIARERFSESAILDSDFLDTGFDDYLSRLGQVGGVNGQFLIIGNPPYSAALKFAKRALDIAATRPGSIVAFLMRLGFIETPSRGVFHTAHPSHLYVLPKRPSFCHSFKCKGTDLAPHEIIRFTKPRSISRLACPKCSRNMSKTSSDATAYAWFVWGDNKPGTWEIL